MGLELSLKALQRGQHLEDEVGVFSRLEKIHVQKSDGLRKHGIAEDF